MGVSKQGVVKARRARTRASATGACRACVKTGAKPTVTPLYRLDEGTRRYAPAVGDPEIEAFELEVVGIRCEERGGIGGEGGERRDELGK